MKKSSYQDDFETRWGNTLIYQHFKPNENYFDIFSNIFLWTYQQSVIHKGAFQEIPSRLIFLKFRPPQNNCILIERSSNYVDVILVKKDDFFL